MRIIPKLNRVLLVLVDAKGDSPIIMPKNVAVGAYLTWKVKEIGDPRILESGERLPIELKIGEEVIINPRYSVDITCNDENDPNFGKPMKICDYAGIIAVVQREKGDGKGRILGGLVLSDPEIE